MSFLTKNSVFHKLIAFSADLDLPKTFRSDLFTHDRKFIEDHPDAVFVWMLYNSGTHVVRIDDPLFNRCGERFVGELVHCVHSTFETDGGQLFFVDGRLGTVTSCKDLAHVIRYITAYFAEIATEESK